MRLHPSDIRQIRSSSTSQRPATIFGRDAMARAPSPDADRSSPTSPRNPEHERLISTAPPDPPPYDDDNDDIPPPPPPKPERPGFPPRRQSSLAQPRTGGPPRTANRVRFNEENEFIPSHANGHAESHSDASWLADEDPLWNSNDRNMHRLPLLPHETPSSTGIADEDFRPEDYLENARPKNGMRNAVMNMANSIVGAGIIGQPYALRQAGLISGVVLLVVLTVAVDWTIRLVAINSKLSGASSFQSIMERCFGRAGLIAISLAQWAMPFGGMIAFCIIIGDTIPHVIAAVFPSLETAHFLWLLTDRRAVIIILVLGVAYPLSLYRDIAKLAKASTFALFSMLIIVITVIVEGPQTSEELRGAIKGSLFINSGIFQAIGVISFAFVCQHNSLLIYGSLKTPTLDRFALVTHYSTGFSLFACMTLALAGFLSFGDRTQGNVLNNFPSNNLMVNVARLCFGLNMLTTLPLECFVCREVMTNYYFPGEPHHPMRHLIFTTGLVVSAMIAALLTCDLGTVFELIGATSACALAYIFPPMCYLRLTGSNGPRDAEWWIKRAPALACVAFGCTVMGITVFMATAKIFRGEGGGHTCGSVS